MEPQMHSQRPGLSVPAAIIIAGAIIGVSLIIGLRSGSSGAAAAAPGAPTAKAVNIKDVKTAGEPYVGNANAPVTLVAWEDYQCPFCKMFETTVLPTLMTDYVNTGKVKIVFKDYEFLGPDSTADAEYARAIWDLYHAKYFAWRTAMFASQPQENSLSVEQNAARLAKVTASIPGIDVAKVKAQVASKKAAYDTEIAADQAEGSSFGIQGTPGFITGTVMIDGAQPLSNFKTAIDAQLK